MYVCMYVVYDDIKCKRQQAKLKSYLLQDRQTIDRAANWETNTSSASKPQQI